MKNKGVLLLKVMIWSQFRINELKDRRSKYRRNTIYVSIAVAMVMVMLTGYSYGMSYGLGSLGLAKIIPSYAITIVSLIIFFFTVFKSNGVLFGYKDYEMQIALPIKIATIISSRFFYMYFMDLFFTIFVMIPMGVAYSQFEKADFAFWGVWILGIMIAPLIPLTLASVIGAVILFVSSRFKYMNGIATFLSVVMVVALMIIPTILGGTNQTRFDVGQISQLGELIANQNKRIYPVSGLFEKAIFEKDVLSLVLMLIISVGWYALFLAILSTKYKNIQSAILSHRTKANYKMKELKASSPLVTLYKKELKRFFSSNVYVLNVGMGAVMALLMTIVIFVSKPSKLEEIMELPGLENVLVKVIALVFSGVLAMSCTTAVSLSLEGKNLWILKSLPLNTKTILDSKILVNLTITVPVAVLFGVFMNLKLEADIVSRMMLFVTPLIFCIFVAVWGMFLNIKFPNYEWESEVTLIKQGMASMLGMFGGVLMAMIGIIFILILPNFPYQLLQIMITVLIGGISGWLYRYIYQYTI